MNNDHKFPIWEKLINEIFDWLRVDKHKDFVEGRKIAESSIVNYLHGRTVPSYDKIDEIAKAIENYLEKKHKNLELQDFKIKNLKLKILSFMSDHKIHNNINENKDFKYFLSDVIDEVKKVTDLPITTKTVPHKFKKPIGAPNLPGNYLVRSDYIKTIKEFVLKQKSIEPVRSKSTLGIHGMGGIGKTILAASIAYDEEVCDAFSDGVFWLTFGKQVNVEARQRDIFLASSVPIPDFSDPQGGSKCLEKFFLNKKCLLILDDVWDDEHVKPFNVLNQGSYILMTSRVKNIIDLYGQSITIDLVSVDEARKFLAATSKQKIEELPSFIEDIIYKCGRLILALSIVGSKVKHKADKNKAWKNILQKLEDNNKDYESFEKSHPDYQYSNLAAAIDIGLNSLKENFRELYFDFALFPEDQAIPEKVLKTFWTNRSYNAIKDYQVEEVLDNFISSSLLTKDKKGNYFVHDLLYDYIRIKLDNDITSRHKLFLASYERLIGSRQWHIVKNDGYFFHWLPWHLRQAWLNEELKELLWNPQWHISKIKNVSVFGLISDLQYGKKELVTNEHSTQFLIDTLYLSAYIIDKDISQMTSQMTGRLTEFEDKEISTYLNKLANLNKDKWLRPLTASLTQPGGPLTMTLSGHSSRINQIAVISDCVVVSASLDNLLKVWDINTGKEILSLKGHTASVTHVAVTADGKIVSASADCTLKVWCIDTGEEIHTLKGHTGSIIHAAIATKEKIVSASSDCTLKVWNLHTGEEIFTLKGHTASINHIAISLDGKAISASSDSTLKVWNLHTGEEIFTLKGHTASVNHIAVTSNQRIVSASTDSSLKVWSIDTGEEIFTLKGHTGPVNHVAIASDGKVVSTSSDSTLKVWNLYTGKELFSLQGHSSPVKHVAITSDGKAISASVDSRLKIWNLEIGKELFTLKGHSAPLTHVALVSEGTAVSSSVDSTLKVWNLNSNKRLSAQESHSDSINHIFMSLDGKVVSASFDSKLKVWDINTGKHLFTYERHSSSVKYVTVTPDGKAVSASLDNMLRVWNIDNGEDIFTLQGHLAFVNHIVLTLDGKAVTASEDSTLRVWSLDTGKEIFALKGHSAPVNHLALTMDGKVVSASVDSTIKVWNLSTGEEIFTLKGHSSSVKYVVIASDSKVISASVDSTIKVWCLNTRKEIFTLNGHSSPVNHLAITKDGKVVSASVDCTLKVWNLESGREILTHDGHSSSVKYVSVTSDGKVVSAAETLKVWDINTRKELSSYKGDYFFRIVKVDEARNVLVAGDSGGDIHFIKMENF